ALIGQLDNQTPQILIEARIVETNDQFRRQLGIQWGGDFVADQSLGNGTGLLFPSTIGIAGGATDGQTPTAGTSSQPNFAVNLPAPAGTGSGGAIGFTFGSLSGAFNLNLRLSAAETQGTAKIVSAPRIMTLDNTQASITSGVSIPVSVVSAAGAQTVFFDASLTLDVTPRVTRDGNIFLDLSITKNEPDF
ncbi:MAG: type IV pilus secretin PilQ, partial [Myxococcales bacterium]|nr:type IV pilus secretin PilQ [Myxococcales bacterium]